MIEITYDDLSDDQKRVHDKTIQNIRNRVHTTITGGPGVGKTTLVKVLFETLKKSGVSGIWLTAPTHQAKNVLSASVGMEATTVHSALKISPTTNEELRVFEQKKGSKIKEDLADCRVFVVDEVSMIDTPMFRIIKRTIPSHCVILGLGDKDQIRPVNNDEGTGELSPFFDEEIFDVLYMDKVMRQAEGNPIIQVSRQVRDGKMLKPMFNNGMGVIQHANAGDFLRAYFQHVKTPDDLMENRMFAYTNENVDKLNAVIRKHLLKTTDPFIVGEIIVMQEPLVQEGTLNGVSFVEILYNNNERIIIEEIQERTDPLFAKGCDQKSEIRYLRMKTTSFDEPEKSPEYINVVVEEEMKGRLSDYLNYVAGTYKRMKQETGYKAPWWAFWAIKNKFQSVKALPVCTYHKAQGSTYDNAFMYTRDAYAFADFELCKQLIYVGVTRARNIVHYV